MNFETEQDGERVTTVCIEEEQIEELIKLIAEYCIPDRAKEQFVMDAFKKVLRWD